MTKKHKIQIHIAAFFIVLCLMVWIVLLHAEKYQEEKAWEHEFLTRYHAALNDVIIDLDKFEETESFENQISCLEAITNDFMQLRAYMEIHIKLVSISMPEEMEPDVALAGWLEVENALGFINHGGAMDFYHIEAFGADGIISEEEAAIIQILKEETEKLYHDMTVLDEDGVNYKYVLSSIEVYQRLTEIGQKVKASLL